MSDSALPKIQRDRVDDHASSALAVRRALCVDEAGMQLPYLAGQPVPSEEARGNIENMIGFAQVPVGIAGPLLFGAPDEPKQEVYVPMATTEGALVASYSRGMGWLAQSGGAHTWVQDQGLSQHPIIEYESGLAAREAALWASDHFVEYSQEVSGITSHGSLVSLDPQVIGRRLILRLVFGTQDAIGINMAARATELIATHLAKDTRGLRVQVHGEDLEKRASSSGLYQGRGRSAQAEVVISRGLLAEKARVCPEDLVAISRSYALGFAHMGTHNWLVQVANGLAAVFVACGQDAAYVGECSTGFLDLDLTASGDLYASVSLPSLLIGTVGGGTGQGTAAECLTVMGCLGAGRVGRFAQILAATVLAGDLSLMAAFCSGEFVAAHEQHGRNRP